MELRGMELEDWLQVLGLTVLENRRKGGDLKYIKYKRVRKGRTGYEKNKDLGPPLKDHIWKLITFVLCLIKTQIRIIKDDTEML